VAHLAAAQLSSRLVRLVTVDISSLHALRRTRFYPTVRVKNLMTFVGRFQGGGIAGQTLGTANCILRINLSRPNMVEYDRAPGQVGG
jgi:hypothetical protein